MKYFSNILATTIVALFLLSFGIKSEAVGQCPSGYSSKTLTMTIAGCPWEVLICYKCDFAVPSIVEIHGMMPIPQTPACTAVPLQQALDYARGQLGNYDYVRNELCNILTVMPPCPGKSDKITFNYFLCWKMKRILYFGEETIYYSICDDAICKVEREYCHEAMNVNVTETIVGIDGTPDCGLEEELVDLPSEFDVWSDCFIYHTPCNPME